MGEGVRWVRVVKDGRVGWDSIQEKEVAAGGGGDEGVGEKDGCDGGKKGAVCRPTARWLWTRR